MVLDTAPYKPLETSAINTMDTMTLQVPSTRRSTIGDRAFPAAAARAWNSLPPATTAANSLLQFSERQRLSSSASRFCC